MVPTGNKAKLIAFCWSTIPQRQFITIIMIIIIIIIITMIIISLKEKELFLKKSMQIQPDFSAKSFFQTAFLPALSRLSKN